MLPVFLLDLPLHGSGSPVAVFFMTVLALTGLFAFGAILETSQLFIAYRYFNFNDVIADGLFLMCLPLVLRLKK
ncbi:MAG: hypothetical protein Q8O28_10550 [Smithellaceae bacterium]|nr:hypothetical protein [Smithellaceae bacterium]